MIALSALVFQIVVALLRWLASRNSAEAVKARILVAAHDGMNKRIGDAKQAALDAIAQLDASGVSDDTHFRD